MPSATTNNASSVYQKFTQLEHILARPDTYVGSLDKDSDTQWVLNKEKTLMERRQIVHIPGLYKIYDEVLVNAIDQCSVDGSVDSIKITVDQASNTVTIVNTGKGIPIEMHSKENMYIPELIFGELLTSSNYDDTQKRTVGGRNGYGAKLANIFSTEFSIDIHDVASQQKYVQTWTNNMRDKTKPKITKKTGTKGYVKFTFKPDLARFGMESLDDDIVALFEKRAYDACACTPEKVNVYYNDNKLGYKNFEKYVDLYIGIKRDTTRVYDSNRRWDVCVCHSDSGYKQVSFVNGINTSVGGTHVDHVTRQLVTKIVDKILSKNASAQIKTNFVKEHMFVFVRATLENPSFSSQTKTECTLKPQNFGSKFEASEDFTKKLLKLGIMDDALALAKHKEMRELSKTDGKKRSTIKGIPKLDDANKAGGSQSKKCTLILTEGDSAKTFAVSGISIVGRDYWGIFPLRGKMLNAREATPKQLLENAEVNAIKQILGLQQGKEYKSVDELRYGKIMIIADADVDGSHIKGLVINFVHHFWPSLMKTDFVSSMVTPVIKATKGKAQHSFYTLSDFAKWKDSTSASKSFSIKYYKGLGTSTSAEAKEYFKNIETNTVQYTWSNDTDESMLLAFKKDQADARKKWITDAIESSATLEYKDKEVTFDEFINKDLIHFSIADLRRSIPSVVDGFKPSQRKVVFACRKRKNTETKVSQLAGYASTESAYHHGEQSLMGTIVTLAQDFVGSNNANMLEPIGQFGTRLMGGKDAASPRYIFTKLSEHALHLIHRGDDPVLTYLDDDGVSIEPEFFVPLLPIVLINGADGIGTGYSSSVPCYSVKDVKANVIRCIDGKQMKTMSPAYNGFTGDIIPSEDGYSFVTKGKYTIDGSILTVTELPIGRWTNDYKEFLDKLLDTTISGYENHSTESHVKFIVKMDSKTLRKLHTSGDIFKEFKLTTTVGTKNMHLFDGKNNIKRYTSPLEIISEFVDIRLKYYKMRKNHIINQLSQKEVVISNKVKFVTMVTNEELVIFRKKKDVIVSELVYLKFDKIDDSFDYLLNMKLYTLTHESISALEAELVDIHKNAVIIKKADINDMWKEDLA